MTTFSLSTTCAVVLCLCAASAFGTSPAGWKTCGGLTPQYNRTACPTANATCCQQKWMPSDGMWGCCPYPNAVCCDDGYTCCPSNMKCMKVSGSGWSVVNKCVPNIDDEIVKGNRNEKQVVHESEDPDAGLAAQVCKTGAPMPFSDTLKNVIIMGDSVSIGYEPKVAIALADVALVQHSPWGGDGGAEETEYGARCVEYLTRAPDGTPQVPDVLYFNWGLHNVGNKTVPGQGGPINAYMPYLKVIVEKLKALGTKLVFGVTTPELCSAPSDQIVQMHNTEAVQFMTTSNIPSVDMHSAIIKKCGKAPQAECFGSKGCFCPHCPANNGLGYAWLANTTIAPAIRKML